jgi:heme/copper-type cytochrome/quinol oxidase subunit 2
MHNTFELIKNNFLIVLFITLIIAGVITAAVLLYNKNKANGATLMQQYAGKKFGELCSSNDMCNSNKCRNNVCVL